MMDIVLFDIPGNTCAMRVEDIERILPADAAVPDGSTAAELEILLGRDTVRSNPSACRALLWRRGIVIGMGIPLGTVSINPEWILPLPGFMFRVKDAPFRGIIDVPDAHRAKPRERMAQRALLLDAELLAARASGHGR